MTTLQDYLALAQRYPDIFKNPPFGGLTIILDEHEIQKVEAEVGQRLAAQGIPVEWVQVGVAYQDQYMLILRDAVRMPDGSVDTCTRSVNNGVAVPGVFILPTYQGNIILIRHFRHKARTWRLEIPGGFGIPGMSSEQSARRELMEEIGATPISLTPLGCLYPDTASAAEYFELFYAEIESYGEIEVQEGITEVVVVSIQEFERMLCADEIIDMNVQVAYARAKLQGLL